MSEVLLSSDDITVLGGPSQISVDIDFGPEGQRGSQIFVGLGNPNLITTTIGQDPIIFDMYINIDSTDSDDYLFMYQYQNVSGTNTWVKLFRLLSNYYSFNSLRTFSDGQVTINVPLINIVPLSNIANYSSEDFNIQYTISGGSNPISSSISIASILELPGGQFSLPITISAIEYDGSAWVNLSGEKTIHMLINVV